VIVTGVVTTYQDNADDPVVWQIVPREAADVAISTEPGGFPNWLLWIALAIAIAVGAALSISRMSARRQLDALRETEARYRQLLSLVPDAVIVHARGMVLFTNPAVADLLGLPSETEVVGKPIADFVHPDSRAAFAEVSGDRAMVATDRAPRVRAQMLNGNGTVVDVEVASSPCVYHDGQQWCCSRATSPRSCATSATSMLSRWSTSSRTTEPARLHSLRRAGIGARSSARPHARLGVRRPRRSQADQ
jgi:PAS domain S-box-containing protein